MATVPRLYKITRNGQLKPLSACLLTYSGQADEGRAMFPSHIGLRMCGLPSGYCRLLHTSGLGWEKARRFFWRHARVPCNAAPTAFQMAPAYSKTML